jgi:hypothetical protein
VISASRKVLDKKSGKIPVGDLLGEIRLTGDRRR